MSSLQPGHFENPRKIVHLQVVAADHSARDRDSVGSTLVETCDAGVALDLTPNLSIVEKDDKATKRIERIVRDASCDAVDHLGLSWYRSRRREAYVAELSRARMRRPAGTTRVVGEH